MLRGFGAVAGSGVGVGGSAIPAANPDEDADGEEGGDGEPGHADLSARQDDEGCEEWTDGGAGVSADLEERLGEAVTTARCHAGDAGGFGMEDGGADSDKGGRKDEPSEGGRHGEEEQAGEGEGHADGQSEGSRGAVA